MANKVLVVYGSKHGATKEIAEKIGEVLKGEGATVDIFSADNVKNAADYQGFVIGSSVYFGQWRKEVKDFISANEKTLSACPVWFFCSGPTGPGDPVKQMGGWVVSPGLKPVIERIKPRDTAVFHGNADVSKMSWTEKLVLKGVKSGIGDLRDWGMITEWAKKAAAEMKN
jgi:menaquinone-dependent protoporphyrinogen oxidase